LAVSDGRRWRLLASPVGEGDLSSVSCVSENDCVAVGATLDGSHPIGEIWGGQSWALMKMPNP
jgi:hypothetical protein